jgi:hypothetical protein
VEFFSSVVKPGRSVQERFRETAYNQKLIQFSIRIGGVDLLHVQGMEPELEKTSGQGISHFPVSVELGTAGNQQGGRDAFGVINALQPGFPVCHLMQLIKNDQRL